jgi:hypothetical protein
VALVFQREDGVVDDVFRPHVDLFAGVVEAQLEGLLHVLDAHATGLRLPSSTRRPLWILDTTPICQPPITRSTTPLALPPAVAAPAERQFVDEVRLELMRDVSRYRLRCGA